MHVNIYNVLSQSALKLAVTISGYMKFAVDRCQCTTAHTEQDDVIWYGLLLPAT